MIASVLVDIKSKQVDRLFDYSVPNHLESIIEIGQRVSIPFGPRFIMGYVLELKNNSEFSSLKEIVDVLDLLPPLTKELIELGKEISVKNTIPLVSIYQAMLPAALKSKYKKNLIVNNIDALTLEMRTYFNKFHQCPYEVFVKEFKKETKSFLKNGVLEVEYIIKQRGNKQTVKYLRLIDESIPVRGEKQKQVVKYLLDFESVLKNQLMEETRTSQSTIKSLIDKGLIEEYSVEKYREIESLYQALDKDIILNQEQKNVYDTLKENLNKEEVFLLHGVTGSGKTEIYLNIIEDVINEGKEAIMLVPEISLTPMMVSRFKGRFQERVALLHSGLSIGEKYDEWRKITRKEVSVVVGARSAIFAPFQNLGVIIIDEEHTDSYKQDTTPRYHAKDIALSRIKTHKIPLVLGSATPSVESFYKAKRGEYNLLTLEKRANNMTLPKVYIEDMREELVKGNISIFSERLETLIEDRLQKKEQVMLLLNRRGHSTFVMCRSCGEVIMCPNCDISLTYHEHTNDLECHYCGYKEPNYKTCPYCDSKHIRYMGIGTEKVEELVRKRFKDARVIRMDRDTTQRKNAHEKLLYEFEHNGDILIGTQMIAKGLDFKKVSLVGVLAADMSLNLPDYQAIEKTFQLLTQVSGRAGRHDILGEVVIQTYNPDHYAIKYAKNHDYQAFYETEMTYREIAGYRPIKQLCQILILDKNVNHCLKIGTKIVFELRKQLSKNTQVLGPVLPKIARINNIYRAQIIIKHDNDLDINQILQSIYEKYSEQVELTIDHNPQLL